MFLILLKKAADDVQNTCNVLKETRSVDQEVVEVLKRKRVARLRHNRESIRKLFGLHLDPAGGTIPDLPQLVRIANANPPRPRANFNDWVKSLDMYGLLKEFTMLTGKLTTEASTLRRPMLERDDCLLRSGLVKQYRADFKNLAIFLFIRI